MITKALQLLEKGKTVKDKADKFAEAIARDLKVEILDALTRRKEALEFEIYDLEDFNLDTNLNAGHRALTKDEVQRRFVSIINKEHELELVKLELESKQAAYDKYFGEVKSV